MKSVSLLTLLLSGLVLTACQSGSEVQSKGAQPPTASSTAPQASSAPSESSQAPEKSSNRSNREAYQDLLETYRSLYQSDHHAFVDLNQDGQEELLIGDGQFVEAIYYLNAGQAEELARSQVAPVGGYRSSLRLYQEGKVLFADWLSGTGQGQARLYRFGPDGLPGLAREEGIQMPPGPDLATWGLDDQDLLDLGTLDWQEGSVQASQTAPGSAGFDFTAIEAGDYSSLAGTWQREEGQTITFDRNGLVADGVSISVIQEENDYLTLSVQAAGGGGYGIILVPAGVALTGPYTQDFSDSSRDRLIAGQNLPSVLETSHFYYRMDD